MTVVPPFEIGVGCESIEALANPAHSTSAKLQRCRPLASTSFGMSNVRYQLRRVAPSAECRCSTVRPVRYREPSG